MAGTTMSKDALTLLLAAPLPESSIPERKGHSHSLFRASSTTPAISIPRCSVWSL
jgi:hypothetical protein